MRKSAKSTFRFVSVAKQGKHLLRKKLFPKHFLLMENNFTVPSKLCVRIKINKNTIVTWSHADIPVVYVFFCFLYFFAGPC